MIRLSGQVIAFFLHTYGVYQTVFSNQRPDKNVVFLFAINLIVRKWTPRLWISALGKNQT